MIKFRNAHFKDLPMSDAVKISYIEMIVNILTGLLVETFSQDVMQMTTRDWLGLLLLPLKLLLSPLTALIECQDVAKYAKQEYPIKHVTYSHFILYWRSYEDFKAKPYRWNE